MRAARAWAAGGLALLLAAPWALACINETGTNRLGQRVHLEDVTGEQLREQLATRMTRADMAAYGRSVVDEARDNPSQSSLNDLAALLVRLHDFQRAATLLEHVERRWPGGYETAANRGTAYELLGRDRDALHWINEGIARNDNAHGGTEWLHARILAAKLDAAAGKAPPPLGQSLLRLDFGTGVLPLRPKALPAGNDGKPVTLYALARAIRYQLEERTEFVDAPEPIVAGLFLDWANLELLAGSIENAAVAYDFALQYGSGARELIALRQAEIARLLAKGEPVVDGDCELCAAEILPPGKED